MTAHHWTFRILAVLTCTLPACGSGESTSPAEGRFAGRWNLQATTRREVLVPDPSSVCTWSGTLVLSHRTADDSVTGRFARLTTCTKDDLDLAGTNELSVYGVATTAGMVLNTRGPGVNKCSLKATGSSTSLRGTLSCINLLMAAVGLVNEHRGPWEGTR